MNLFQKSIEIAIKNLETAGCEYTIKDSDGGTFTNIKEVVSARKKRVQLVPPGTYYKIYEPVLRDAQPGELRVFEVPEGLNVEMVRSSACAWASRNWGMNTYTSEVAGSQVRVLRS